MGKERQRQKEKERLRKRREAVICKIYEQFNNFHLRSLLIFSQSNKASDQDCQ